MLKETISPADIQANIIPLVRDLLPSLHVLVVDDDQMMQRILSDQVEQRGFKKTIASNGRDALKILTEQTAPIDIVLLDRSMPVLDGMAVVRHMKATAGLKHIPVVMLTAYNKPDEIQEGINAGVFYYLAKPFDKGILESVLTAAENEVKRRKLLTDELKKHRASFELIDTCKFSFQTIDEAICLAAFMALCFPEPERVMDGLAYLMINAVEHGNLGIGYERKTELLKDGLWKAEVDKRLKSDVYKNKKAEAILSRREDGLIVSITDEGEGFRWRDYIRVDPSRASDSHGRSIAQAASVCFDKLSYNDKGNKVVVFVGGEQTLEW